MRVIAITAPTNQQQQQQQKKQPNAQKRKENQVSFDAILKAAMEKNQ